MHLSWSEVLAALKAGDGESVLIRDGKVAEPAVSVRSRPSAKGSELCLFPGDPPATRLELIRQLETLAQSAGRRFMTSARASINQSLLLIESVHGEEIDAARVTVLQTRRAKLGFNQSQQTGDRSTLRSKRIK